MDGSERTLFSRRNEWSQGPARVVEERQHVVDEAGQRARSSKPGRAREGREGTHPHRYPARAKEHRGAGSSAQYSRSACRDGSEVLLPSESTASPAAALAGSGSSPSLAVAARAETRAGRTKLMLPAPTKTMFCRARVLEVSSSARSRPPPPRALEKVRDAQRARRAQASCGA